MNRLPLDVFRHIFFFLTYQEKYECLTVCKNWCKLIQNDIGFYKYVSINHYHQFDCCYNFFDNNPQFKTQVKTLNIDETEMDVVTFLMLPVIFPNVEHFSVGGQLEPFNEWNDSEAKSHFSVWKDKVKSVEETGCPIVGPTLLQGGVCPNLEKLVLGFENWGGSDIGVDMFINCLGNAPQLKYLTIMTLGFLIEVIEKVFNNCPNLKAISLYKAGFQKGNPPKTAKPLMSLETLCIDQSFLFMNENDWFSYFKKKCPNIKNLILTHEPEEGLYSQQRPQLSKTGFKTFLKGLKQLEQYIVHMFPLTSDISNALDDNKNIKLKKMSLGGYDVIEQLKVLEKSRQRETIETLILSGESYDGFRSGYKTETNFLKALAKFPNLKHLQINQSKEEVWGPDGNKVSLDLIMKHLNLETFQTDFATIDINPKNVIPFKTNMKKLILEECILSSGDKSGDDHYNEIIELFEKKLPDTEVFETQLRELPYDEEYAELFVD